MARRTVAFPFPLGMPARGAMTRSTKSGLYFPGWSFCGGQAQCFFRIRAVGQKTGLITSWGGGAFGFMRSLALRGPLTVPQIAQMRPTSRQRMQRLADELAAEGLVTFIENPKHRRSKLVQLTRKGEARYRELNARFLAIASTMGVALSEADIRRTSAIVRQLSDDVKARSQRLS